MIQLLRRWGLFRKIRYSLVLVILALCLSGSSLPSGNEMERARAFTRNVEFDYIMWTFKALGNKISQDALETSRYIEPAERNRVVYDYLDLVENIQRNQAALKDFYTNPEIQDPETESAVVRHELDRMVAQKEVLQPIAEAILQNQISQVLVELNLDSGGQTLPPVLYQTTSPPSALIISPRNVIRQDLDISISPDLSVAEHSEIEAKVDKNLNVSSLVVGIGGIGLYPTMVMQTTNLNWLIEVVAHEWTHNYLTLRPLGMSYMNSPELRIMNETAASIAGKEIGRVVIQRFYPELLPKPAPATENQNTSPATPEPPSFDYRAEMHATRIEVDRLLSLGKISEAEAYMEARRLVFWENGYHIRKINQAYFAFYGAYADEAVGAAGQDPVGAAVRLFRSQNSSLSAFIKNISKMWSYEQLKGAVKTAQ